jgi:adenylate cyclase
VVVGNIGSTKRSKYGVVGRTINTTARIESFTVGGQVIVSPTLIQAAGPGLILGDDVEVHAKGMREALRCRQLLGHADRPELNLREDTDCTPLPEPIRVSYVQLTGKHFDEQMTPATLIALSRRRAVMEMANPLPPYANLLLRLEAEAGEQKAPELYAKVIRILDGPGHRCSIQFTSVPAGVRARLDRFPGNREGPSTTGSRQPPNSQVRSCR